ncbi:MAG TPA: flagellar biosynthetic protein FliO [Paucimonas sp.]|nr:flagellar biosynthetic protein FliO [Paucimonas sp.]
MHAVKLVCGLGLCALMQLANAAAPADAAIPFKREQAVHEPGIGRVVIALAVCGAALGGALYVLRRRFGSQPPAGNKEKLVRIVETQRLTPRSALYVVEFGRTHYLLAHSEQGIACVAASVPKDAEKHDG